MSRPLKNGIDYFSLDVVLDTKFELIEAEFGLNGFGVAIKLYQKIYEQGYYIKWTNEVALLFAKKVGLGGSAVSEIVKASIKRGIFDKDLYYKYHILTSRGIQKRYFEAISRRKQIEVDTRYLLVKVDQICQNARINRVNVDINSRNDDDNPQSKVKESKVKESIIGDEKSSPTKNFIKPTVGEIEAYCLEASYRIDAQRFFDYYESQGWHIGKNSMKDWQAAVRTWARREHRRDSATTHSGNSSLDMDKLGEMLHRGNG